jgi:sucrose-phosphate synthase
MNQGHRIILISLHGLIRGQNLELGRDADTGGQTRYVLELARALGEQPGVEQVDLLTRQVFDSRVDEDYARPVEPIGEKVRIVRLPFGPRRYLRKEALWPYLDDFVDKATLHIRNSGVIPTVIHGHYADAGYAGATLASLLEVPFIFTGHSLGRDKRRLLMEKGTSEETLERRYNISTRIEAEEFALSVASLVVASTRQEITVQYSHYDNHHTKKMLQLPPGVDLARFSPARDSDRDRLAKARLQPFLRQMGKPLILALCRPDERKNVPALLEAYATTPGLKEKANLALVLGNRDEFNQLGTGARRVFYDLLALIDRHDLYGHVALPKHHEVADVPAFYRLVKQTGGVFANVALTEPFGLTLIEAAACGAPILATDDGGPQDIIKHCKNGLLVDPLDTEAIGNALNKMLSAKRDRWRRWSKNGINNVHKHYSWEGHAAKYIKRVDTLARRFKTHTFELRPVHKLSLAERLLVCDIDNTLTGDHDALSRLGETIAKDPKLAFGVATGRHIESARKVLKEWRVPMPELFITSVGSEIHYGKKPQKEPGWRKHINHRWDRDGIVRTLKTIRGLRLQPAVDQREHKISYTLRGKNRPDKETIVKALRHADLAANVIVSHGEFVDILPIRASKGHAVRYIALKWGLPFENILVAGDSGNDEAMLTTPAQAVVVGNYSPELGPLKKRHGIYFASLPHAGGIMEGLHYYDFINHDHKGEDYGKE